MKRFSKVLAFLLALVLSVEAGPALGDLSSTVSAQVPSDIAATGLAGTVAGIVDQALVSSIFTITGEATSSSGRVLSVEVYLDGKYAPTALTGEPADRITYSCTIDPAFLSAGLHRIDVVVFGDSGAQKRIGGLWFHAEPLTASAALVGLAEGDVVSATRTVTAHLVESTTPIASVEMQIDGQTQQTFPLSPATRRPDLTFVLDRSLLSAGRRTLTLVTVDTLGNRRVAEEAFFQVPRGGGAIDQPADFALVGASTLSGYVLHGSGVASVEADLDGTKVWSGQAATPRTEASLGATVLGADPKGFAFTLDTTLYANGPHELRITAIPTSGSPVVVETRTIYIDNHNPTGMITNVTSFANGRVNPTTVTSPGDPTPIPIPLGTAVEILATVQGQIPPGGQTGNLWCRVRFMQNNVTYDRYVYAYYVLADPTVRTNSVVSLAFDGMQPYPSDFTPSRTEYSAIVAAATDRIRITRFIRYPGASPPVVLLDGNAVADPTGDILLSPGRHSLVVGTSAVGPDPGQTYTFDVLRLSDQTGVVNADGVRLRSAATATGTVLLTLAKGASVIVKAKVQGDLVNGTDVWYRVHCFDGAGTAFDGYVLSTYIQVDQTADDLDFYLSLLVFPASYQSALWDIHIRHPLWKLEPLVTGLSWSTVLTQESLPGARRNLTTWYSANSNDFYSLLSPDHVPGGATPPYNSAGFDVYDSPNWVAASQKMVAYYLDPRNFFDDRQIFQFEQLSYDSDVQTLAGIENILTGTYMSHRAIGNDASGHPILDAAGQPMTYAEAFLEAAKISRVSPYHLASKARMEVTANVGGVPSLTASALGTLGGGAIGMDPYPTTPDLNRYYVCNLTPPHADNPVALFDGSQNPLSTIFVHYYAGYFNFYNIGAFPDPSVANGDLKNAVRFAQWGQYPSLEDTDPNWASEQTKWMLPWTDAYRAIVGGAKYFATSYISVGQDTMYLEKFQVVPVSNSLYWHQFVQNVQAARDEGVKYYDAYNSMGSLESAFVFSIPVYTGMPDTISPRPS